VVKTLAVNGYSRQQEAAADLSGMTFMQRIGYDPNSFADYLERLAKEQSSGASRGLFATHPGMTERLSNARSFIIDKKCQRTNHLPRDRRFQQSME
jgi:predicted Zn-dependent protease